MAKRASAVRAFIREHRRPLLAVLGAALLVIFIFGVLPQLAGLAGTLHRLRNGNKLWLAVGLGLESISLLGYVALFRLVFSCEGVHVTWGSSIQITLAGTVATKLLAAGGAAGIALTVWALRAAGLSAKAVARRMTSFEILLYAVFMLSLVIFGGGLALGIIPGRAPQTLTLVPCLFGIVAILVVAVVAYFSDRAERALARLERRGGSRVRRWLAKLAPVPGTLHGGLLETMKVLRQPRPDALSAVAYWAFDIATLWASFRAFGAWPPVAVVVIAYFVGQLANLLPLPGGIGGVEGGMIGSFIAFGINGGTAVLAVLAYRIISFWLPVLPGSVAYVRLRAAVSSWREQEEEEQAAATR